jgi:signal transduction histidine kinase
MGPEAVFFLSSNPGDSPVRAQSISDTSRESSDVALAGTMQQLIEDLPEEIALLDGNGTILAANTAWMRTVQEHGHPEVMPGTNYLENCRCKAAEGYEPAIEAAVGLEEVMSGTRTSWELTYNGGDRWAGRDYRISVQRVGGGSGPLISVTRTDLTEILQLRRLKDDFTRSLVERQAVERRRLTRELHDSTSQLLATVGLVLGRFRFNSPNSEALGVVAEVQQLVSEAQREIRAISYLGQPPALDRRGLASALEPLAEGFGRRTNVRTSFAVDGGALSFSVPVETALFRVAQEALSNVHRHARASHVSLCLYCRKSTMHLVVADDGIGISDEALAGRGGAGVGLAGMRSRLSEIGGRLTVRRLSRGTAIIATVGDFTVRA